MYVMTPLTSEHSGALDELLDSRMERQIERQHVFDGEAARLVDLVQRADSLSGKTAVGLWDGEVLVGAIALQWAAPEDGWTIEERQEPTLLVALAHAHPSHRRVGRLLTPWVRDYAARQHNPPAWVRCTVRVPRLADYFQRTCGWQSVREVALPGKRTMHLLQQTPKTDDGLGSLIRSEGQIAPTSAEQGGLG